MKLRILEAILIGIIFSRNADSVRIDDNLERAANIYITQEFFFPAKDSFLDGSKITYNNNGYTGEGFIDFGGVGTSASWLVDIPMTGFYEVTIRYASKSDRGPLDLLIDDIKIGVFEIKKVANNWNTWMDETIEVRIDAGRNRILKILASFIQGPNVDKITAKLLRPISPDEPVQEDVDYKVVLSENECLEKGEFQESESGLFEIGFDQSGYLVLRRKASSEILWSLKVLEENFSSKICMKNDGNLVIQPVNNNQPICGTESAGIYERNFGFHFGINNSGGIAVYLDSKNLVWTGGLGSEQPIEPTRVPIPVPTRVPTFPPTNVPTLSPTYRETTQPPTPSKNQNNKDSQYKQILSQNNYFGREKKNFGQSDSGEFEVGLNGNGNLVVRKSSKASDVVWILKDSNGRDIVADRFYMQNDGNLVMRAKEGKAVWTSKTADSNGRTGYSFGINNYGGIAVFLDSNSTEFIWTGGIQEMWGDITPQEPSTLTPVLRPVARPTLSPVALPNPTSDLNSPTSKPYSVVLATNDRLIDRGQFVSSPNGQYTVGLDPNGKLILRRGKNNDKVWTLMDKNGEEISNVSRMYMQSDGNLVLKTSSNKGLTMWSSETSNNLGSEFRIDDGGQLSINFQGASLWIDGLPQKIYTGPSSSDLNFPIRGFFYYAVSR